MEKRICKKCGKEKNFSDYSNSSYGENGKLNWCNTCKLSISGEKLFKDLLADNKIPFNEDVYQSICDKTSKQCKRNGVVIQKDIYKKIVSSYLSQTNINIKGNVLKPRIKKERQEKNIKVDNVDIKSKINKSNKAIDMSEEELDIAMEKWGYGYTEEEYFYFDKKYNLLKNNYPERTAMHTESLLTYIRYRVKEEIATAKGDVKESKEWGALAREAARDAKINPNQLSKADLTEGLDSFGQLNRTIEQVVDVIEILPKFKEKPQDKPDFVIWAYVNYARDLKGLPPAEYKDIYAFYEERKKEYESRLDDIEESVL